MTRQVGGNVALPMPQHWEQNSIPSIKNWAKKVMAHFSSFSPPTKLNLWNWNNTANSWGLWSQPTDLMEDLILAQIFKEAKMDSKHSANAGPMLTGRLVGYFHRKQTQAINFKLKQCLWSHEKTNPQRELTPLPGAHFKWIHKRGLVFTSATDLRYSCLSVLWPLLGGFWSQWGCSKGLRRHHSHLQMGKLSDCKQV